MAEELLGRVVVLRLRLLKCHQVFGVDDLPLHVAPLLVGRVLREVIPPCGQGFGVLLLQLVTTAQQVSRVGYFVALGVTFLFQKPLQTVHCVFVTTPMDKAASNLDVCHGGQLVVGETLDKCVERRRAKVQLLVIAGRGD